MNLRHAVGSLLIVGVEGTTLSPFETAWLKIIRPGGIILFRRNIESAAEVHALLEAASRLGTERYFRCVDLEGGLVDRLRDLIAQVPSAAEVAATGQQKLFQQHGRLIGDEVALIGFNATFAPVLDLALPVSLPVMRSRSTSADPLMVATYGAEFLRGLHKAGVLGAGKHFPGLGGGTLDSHQVTPEIDRSWEQLWNEDLLPYRKLRRKLPIVMISHAAYPRMKQDRGPASISSLWISTVLKKRIGYRGLVLSDDMEMGGILNRKSIEEASIDAILAGTHLLEICKQPELILRTYEALLGEAEKSKVFRRKIEAAATHVEKSKKRLSNPWKLPSQPPSPEQIEAIRKRIATFTSDVNAARTRTS